MWIPTIGHEAASVGYRYVKSVRILQEWANQPLDASILHHRVDQLTAIVSQQQAVIAEFMEESWDFWSIVTGIENLTTLASNMLELKDAFMPSTRPTKMKKGRLDSKVDGKFIFSPILILLSVPRGSRKYLIY